MLLDPRPPSNDGHPRIMGKYRTQSEDSFLTLWSVLGAGNTAHLPAQKLIRAKPPNSLYHISKFPSRLAIHIPYATLYKFPL